MLARLPKLEAIYPVYGVIVTLIYGWSVYRFIWKFPSWLKFLVPGEIVTAAFYTLVSDLFESLLILAVLILFAFVLPGKWMRENFIFRGGLSALSVLGLFIGLAYFNVTLEQVSKYWFWALVGFVLLHILFGKIHPLQTGIEKLADAASIFLYLTVPLSMLSLLVVLFRNILDVQ
jgi:hypothetical protein